MLGIVNVELSSSFPRGLPGKTWDEVIRNDLKGRKVSKDIAKGRNARKSFIRYHPTNATIEKILKQI